METADLGGLDIFYNISAYLNADLADDKEGSTIIKKCVDEGNLGAKTGTGLYQWHADELNAIKERREEILIEWLQKDKHGEKF